MGRRYRLIYEPLSSKQVPLNLVQIARWLGTQDEPVRKSLEKAEPFTWLKHLKGTSKSSRSSRYLSALIMEEYVHAQNLWDRMQALSVDSPVSDSESHFPMTSQPLSFLSSSKLMNAGISFKPKATGTTPSDTASRRSPDSTFSSVATDSSFFGPILLSPVSSRFKDFAEKVIERPIDDASSSNGSVSSDNGPPQLLSSVPDVSLQPPSSEDVAARRSAVSPSLDRASSIGSSESTNPPLVQVENQSLSSSKSSKPRGRRMSLHAKNPGRRGSPREESEESLRLEYEAKAT